MNKTSEEILDWLRNGGAAAPALALVLAHPDDETIGAGGRLDKLRAALFVYLTDGAPRDPSDARAAGCDTREEYARARAAELDCALACAGIDRRSVVSLNYVDQEAAFAMAGAARVLADLFAAAQCEAVLTHPYEGGHPDHDAAAFAVAAARDLLARRRARVPAPLEMTSYHRRGGTLETGSFLPVAASAEVVAPLSDGERQLKARLLACYRTQQRVLQAFSLDEERFRPAPSYDFSAPPHPGELHYETLQWPITGKTWRRLAAQALEEIRTA